MSARRSLQTTQTAQTIPAPTNAMPSAVIPAPISVPPAAQQGPYYAYPFPGQPSHTPEPGQNPPFVLFYFEKDHFWPIHPARAHHVFSAFKDTILDPIFDMTLRWRQDQTIRRQMDFLLDSNNRSVPSQLINGKGYVAEEQGTGIQYPVHSLQILPSGHLQVIWPMMLKDELDIKSNIMRA
ncbi:unnamed protein product [Caenorhabditis brenneri]